jgi:hypothetical protein
MPRTDDPLELERTAWRALAGDGDPAALYEEVLADDVLMLFPGGLVIDDRQAVIESMQGPPWDEFALSDEHVLRLGESAEVVAYRASARRGAQQYDAWCNSTYVRHNGAWHLAVHQQTPV